MIDGIIKWSLENRFFVVLAAAMLFVWGSWQAINMPVDVFPNLTAPSVTVIVEAHGKAPEEVESQITDWHDGGMEFKSGLYGDVVTTFRKPK